MPATARTYMDPVFFVKLRPVNGKEVLLGRDISHQITSFEFISSTEAMDQLTVILANIDPNELDDDIYQPGVVAEVRFGYTQLLSKKFFLITKTPIPEFPETGAPTLKIVALDSGQLFTAQSQAVYTSDEPGGEVTESEVVASIARLFNLKAVVEPTKNRYKQISQAGRSFFAFLDYLAQNAVAADESKVGPYIWYVQNDELHFHPRSYQQEPVDTFIYYRDGRGTLINFTPRLESEDTGTPGTSIVIGLDPETGEPFVAYSNNESAPSSRAVLGDSTATPANPSIPTIPEDWYWDGASISLSDGSVIRIAKERTAQDAATTDYMQKEQNAVEADATFVGDPRLVANTLVRIEGVGKKFSGLWYVKEARHLISNGYITECRLSRNGLNQGQEESTGTEVSEGKWNGAIVNLGTGETSRVWVPPNPAKTQASQ